MLKHLNYPLGLSITLEIITIQNTLIKQLGVINLFMRTIMSYLNILLIWLMGNFLCFGKQKDINHQLIRVELLSIKSEQLLNIPLTVIVFGVSLKINLVLNHIFIFHFFSFELLENLKLVENKDVLNMSPKLLVDISYTLWFKEITKQVTT